MPHVIPHCTKTSNTLGQHQPKPTTMVSAFRRSLSFSNTPKPKPHYHVRSISLPCRSHPIVSQLEDEIHALRAWRSRYPCTPALLCASFTQLELLLDSLEDLLRLPQSHDTLRRARSSWPASLLEDFLHLADACGTFRSSTLALKQHASDAQVAVRAKDEPRLASCVRSMKRAEKELAKLAPEHGTMSKSTLGTALNAEEVEMAGIMREVAIIVKASLASVFSGVAGVCSSSTVALMASFSASWMVGKLRRKPLSEDWRRDALEKLGELEECVKALESRVDRLFRSLVNTRVSLLNLLTPSV